MMNVAAPLNETSAAELALTLFMSGLDAGMGQVNVLEGIRKDQREAYVARFTEIVETGFRDYIRGNLPVENWQEWILEHTRELAAEFVVAPVTN